MTDLSPYPWFDELWQQWLRLLSQRKLGHAYLLTGISGLGKHALLTQMAASILCHKQTDVPCGQCTACHWFSVGTHPDYLIAEMTGSIGIDLVRQWREFCYQTPAAGVYKVMVLVNCERLTVPAANALLKILEEPPASCIWLLSSSHSAELPATLMSRCQRLTCPPVSLETGMAWLQAKQPDQSSGLLQQALRSVNGAPLAAQQWLQAENSVQRERCYQQFQKYFKKQVTSQAVYQTLWPALQDQLPQLLFDWILDLIRAQQLGEEAIINREYAEVIQQISQQVSREQLWQWYDQLLLLRRQMALHVNFGYWFLNWLFQLDRECCYE
jgi:DNA polymerase-3 subunit delta'